jgi:hypothetical protein
MMHSIMTYLDMDLDDIIIDSNFRQRRLGGRPNPPDQDTGFCRLSARHNHIIPDQERGHSGGTGA